MIWLYIFLGLLAVVAIHDITQRTHTILRNFPIVGHFRYWLEAVGPELRQYIVTNNNEERPFSRDQRRWVYSSAKKQNNYFGFGTDHELEQTPGTIIIRHSAFPLPEAIPGGPGFNPAYPIPCAKIMGGFRKRKHAFRPRSIINVSGMSYGSLSGPAVEALNRGSKLAGCLQSTGEGGVSKYHQCGGDLIWQIGTGYFGCRTADGEFSRERFLETIAKNPQIKALEVKLSQGAKPGLGGILPAPKVTQAIAETRGIPVGKTCFSPSNHRTFGNIDQMLDFIEELADLTGLPVGIKSAVGEIEFWQNLAYAINASGRAPDFITIDGGEGGTGAGPLVFTDHVAFPFKLGFGTVFREFAQANLTDKIVFIGSGKLGFPEAALFALGMGCDMIGVAREPMLAIGCIQAQRCHTGHCPTGVATMNKWLVRGLDPTLKSARAANYIITLRKELVRLAHACGVAHPALIPSDRLCIIDNLYTPKSIQELFHYAADWSLPAQKDHQEIVELMTKLYHSAET